MFRILEVLLSGVTDCKLQYHTGSALNGERSGFFD